MTDQERTMIMNLKKKTGTSLEEWIRIVKASGLEKHGDIMKLLKGEHGLTHGFANMVTHKARQSDAGSAASTDDLVEAQYSGKEGLRPIYDSVIEQVKSFGSDVEIAPKKSYVSLRRAKQFGLLQPSTKTRFDIGLNLKGVEPEGKLEAAGSFNSMCTHRIRCEDVADLDAGVIAWLKQAYENAG